MHAKIDANMRGIGRNLQALGVALVALGLVRVTHNGTIADVGYAAAVALLVRSVALLIRDHRRIVKRGYG